MMKVLLAEDHKINRMMMQKQLEVLGCEVVAVEDGALAVTVLKQEAFAACLFDLQMPNLDGYGAAQESRALGFEGPIVAISGSLSDDDRDKARQCGFDAFATKPLDASHLKTVLGL